jgi:four helix bundle protein
LRLISPFL